MYSMASRNEPTGFGRLGKSGGIHYQNRLRELGFTRSIRSSVEPGGSSAKSSGRNGFAMGNGDRVSRCLYKNMSELGEWNPECTLKHTHHGGIFGLDYSPDGSILGAACENRSLLLFDPLNAKLINSVDSAHIDCANSVKFLDNRLLASCSDDMTVKLWDVRNMRQSFRTMRAHNNWVKNIEFINDKGLLLSSAFDGNVYSWDVNDANCEPKRLFFTPGLMRMRLTPDASKMVLSTHWGYLLCVHNLDLNQLSTDLSGFKPNMYWLMIKSQTQFASSGDHACRFAAERNRTEMILDFPADCDPENISSLSPHPQGWCLASRSNNHDERSEWTCVHDLQLPTLEELLESGAVINEDEHMTAVDGAGCSTAGAAAQQILLAQGVDDDGAEQGQAPFGATAEATVRIGDGQRTRAQADVVQLNNGPPFLMRQHRRLARNNEHMITLSLPAANRDAAESNASVDDNDQMGTSSDSDDDRLLNEPTVHAHRMRALRNRRRRINIRNLRGSGDGVLEGRVSRRGNRSASNAAVEVRLRSSQFNTRISLNSAWSEEPRAFFIRSGPPASSSRTIVVLGGQTSSVTDGAAGSSGQTDPLDDNVHIPRTYNRLVYYAEEPRVGRGFIKEQCWSNDGRVLASPHGFGVRLLAFSPSCQELCDVSPSTTHDAKAMSQIAFNVPHSSVVLCTKFSPTHCILASGCLKGKLVFQQPRF